MWNCQSKFRSSLVTGAAFLTASATGCMGISGQDLVQRSVATSYVYEGCVKATGLDTSSIRVEFVFPAEAKSIRVYRNGNKISEVTGSGSSFDDTELEEGVTYRYTCEAVVSATKSSLGAKYVDASTLTVNAPTFLGIETAVVDVARAVKVTWKLGGGKGSVKVGSYKIWATLGPAVDFSSSPVQTVKSGSTTTITGLGDELKYSFGVRACSSADICDTNSAALSVTVPDAGAPLSAGVTTVTTQSSTALVTVPWTASQGAVKYRYIYQKTSNTITLGSDTPVKSVTVSDPQNPSTVPTQITVNGLAENTTYYFAVRDVDPTGNSTAISSAYSLTTGDLTPPAFSDVPVLTAGTPADTAVNLSFIAIDNQGVNPAGAWQYSIYRTSIPEAAIPADPCSPSGQLVKTIPAAGYTSGQTVSTSFSGLVSRTNYAFCVKASDQIGNLSDNSSYGTIKTRDITPPTFDGVSAIAYDNGLSKLNVTYPWSSSADIKEYKIRVWRVPSGGQNTSPCGNTTTNCGSVTSFTQVHPATISGVTQTFSFSTTDFVFAGGDRLYASVDACDNASPTFGAQNCTAFPAASALSLIVPDTTPPAAFAGITAFNPATDRPSEGTVTVHWAAPPSWSDYRGFKVYTVDTTHGNALSEVKDCACSGADCPDMITSCSISGLLPYKTYYFHVRAYDAGGNLTTYLDPAASRFSIQTTDLTAPTFSSAVSAAYSGGAGGIVVSWTAGTDAQADSSTLTYTLYRKDISTFATATSPSTGGTLKISKTAAPFTYTDTTSLVEGQTLYYSLCVKDQSNNSKCDGTIAQVTVPDLTPPVISAVTLKGRIGYLPLSTTPSHTLSWAISDNVTANASLSVQVQRAVSSSPTMTFAASDTVVAQGYNLTTLTENVPVLGVTSGQYIHYLITVTDSATNSTTYQTKTFVYPCPQNFVYFAADATYGTKEFCAAKYEMKATTDGSVTGAATLITGNTGTSSGTSPYTSSEVPASRPDGKPWDILTKTQAVNECASLGANYRLPTNADWQVMARHFITQPSNWSSGTVGTGAIASGHNDNVPANPLAADPTDADPWYLTGQASTDPATYSGWGQRRTHNTSYGEIMWDLSGNVAEWVSDPIQFIQLPATQFVSNYNIMGPSMAQLTTSVGYDVMRLIVAPATLYASGFYGYQMYSTQYSVAPAELYRGGGWNSQNYAGLFTWVTNNVGSASGFRCVYEADPTNPIAPVITSHTNNQATKAVSLPVTGTCDARPGTVTTASVTGAATIRAVSCVSGFLQVHTLLPTGSSAAYTVTVTSTRNSVASSTTLTVNNTVPTCPSNYVLVPGSYQVHGNTPIQPTVGDFCVAKYEMKAASSVGGALSNAGSSPNPWSASYVADSRWDGFPWAYLTQANAQTSCQALGTGYRLPTNAEWQTLARNIESVGSNWIGGAVGSGAMFNGHTDATPYNTLAADASDTNNYTGTGDSAPSSQRRTHTLTTGAIVWDVGGNVGEWTSDNLTTIPLGAALPTTGWLDQNISALTIGATLGAELNRLYFSPVGNYTSASQNIGKIFYDGTGTAYMRGGHFAVGTALGGVFMNAIYTPTYVGVEVGFRCVGPIQ